MSDITPSFIGYSYGEAYRAERDCKTCGHRRSVKVQPKTQHLPDGTKNETESWEPFCTACKLLRRAVHYRFLSEDFKKKHIEAKARQDAALPKTRKKATP